MTSMDSCPITGPDLGAPVLTQDPYGEFDRLRESAPVVRGRFLDGSPMWWVTRYEDARLVLGDDRFANSVDSVPGGHKTDVRARLFESLGVPEDLSRYLVGTIIDTDGPTHTRLRKLVSRAFTVRRVTQLRPSVEQIAAELLGELSAGTDEPVDLITRFCYPLPIAVICDLVGIPRADRPAWRVWSRGLLDYQSGGLAAILREVVDYLHQLIDARRAVPADDLLSDLIRAHDEDSDRFSDVELVMMVLSLVFAGHETTANLIGNGTFALLTHPDQLELLRSDPALWPSAVHELMRCCSPVLITALRYAREDVRLSGILIRTGDAVQAVLVSANRDPREYPEPARLDVTRRARSHTEGHIGFGHGPHYCLGAALARQEAEVALRALFERFPGLALATDPTEPRWQQTPGSRRLEQLPVRL
ncbi:MAG TPA: cytochrome P450 [Pseudonocardia sp.]|uniref:cytochrome P450 family protein n=1 Tax=Pseudonocardia sp. TaxID=60912 RepID=UPI002F41C9EF